MPNIKSAEKRVGVTARQNLRNRMVKSNLKTSMKKLNTEIEAGEKEASVREAYRAIDQACAKGIMHKNTAAHKKAQIAKKAAL